MFEAALQITDPVPLCRAAQIIPIVRATPQTLAGTGTFQPSSGRVTSANLTLAPTLKAIFTDGGHSGPAATTLQGTTSIGGTGVRQDGERAFRNKGNVASSGNVDMNSGRTGLAEPGNGTFFNASATWTSNTATTNFGFTSNQGVAYTDAGAVFTNIGTFNKSGGWHHRRANDAARIGRHQRATRHAAGQQRVQQPGQEQHRHGCDLLRQQQRFHQRWPSSTGRCAHRPKPSQVGRRRTLRLRRHCPRSRSEHGIWARTRQTAFGRVREAGLCSSSPCLAAQSSKTSSAPH